jgi:hypothetical protein
MRRFHPAGFACVQSATVRAKPFYFFELRKNSRSEGFQPATMRICAYFSAPQSHGGPRCIQWRSNRLRAPAYLGERPALAGWLFGSSAQRSLLGIDFGVAMEFFSKRRMTGGLTSPVRRSRNNVCPIFIIVNNYMICQ